MERCSSPGVTCAVTSGFATSQSRTARRWRCSVPRTVSWCRDRCSPPSGPRSDGAGSAAPVRSGAWIWDFSSIHGTTAFSGGSRYRPTTSMILASRRGSVAGASPPTRTTRPGRPSPSTAHGVQRTRTRMNRVALSVHTAGVRAADRRGDEARRRREDRPAPRADVSRAGRTWLAGVLSSSATAAASPGRDRPDISPAPGPHLPPSGSHAVGAGHLSSALSRRLPRRRARDRCRSLLERQGAPR